VIPPTLSIDAAAGPSPPLPSWLARRKVGHLRIGSETCAHRLPSADTTQVRAEDAARRGLGVELVIPVLSDGELDGALDLVGELAASPVPVTVVVNDLGLLHRLTGRDDVALAAGRLLHRQQRDPRLTDLAAGRLGVATWPRSWLLGAAVSPSWRAWIASCGVTRLEVDLPVVGEAPFPVPDGLALTLHLPRTLVAAGRRCVDVVGEPGACTGPCQERGADLRIQTAGGGEARLWRAGRAEWAIPSSARLAQARRWLEDGQGPDRVAWGAGV